MLKQIFKIPRYIIIILIRVYQKTLSPDHSWLRHAFPYGLCRFNPTCSDYAVRALKKYGVLRGGIKALWRIARCNPCSRGGRDELR